MTDPTGPDDVVYETTSSFNTIYVVESLPRGDLRTGEDLYDSVLRPAEVQDGGPLTEYHRVESPDDLHKVLAMIEYDCLHYGRGPILHIEAHGRENGLELSNGEFVEWRELIGRLARINQACRMNLTVVAAMCRGWYLTEALMPSDRAPVFSLIGPPQDVEAGVLLDGMKAFYRVLIADLDWNRALSALNGGRPFLEWTLKPATAEILFCRVFQVYLQVHGSAVARQAREEELVAQFAAGMPEARRAHFRLFVRRELSRPGVLYDQLRRRFLMLDAHPENRERFGLTYEKCMREQA